MTTCRAGGDGSSPSGAAGKSRRTGLAQSALPFSTEALGWLARVHGLAGPREFREPAHEEAAPA